VLPYLALLLAFGIGPAVYGIATSFFDTSTASWRFNGLANYTFLLQNDYRLPQDFSNLLWVAVVWLPSLVVIVVGLSLLLHARLGWFSSAMRTVYYLPGAVAGSATVMLAVFMMTPSISPFGIVLNHLGVHSFTDLITTRALPIDFALMAISTGAGGWIVVFVGALTNISHEILEAATIDGCNSWQTAFFVKLPLMSRYLVLMVILSFAGGVQLFVEPSLMDAASFGGVGVWSPNQLAYWYAFTNGDFGKAAALSVGLLLISLVGAVLIIVKTDFYRLDK
jgi:multiple sugar transport system permease protein